MATFVDNSICTLCKLSLSAKNYPKTTSSDPDPEYKINECSHKYCIICTKKITQVKKSSESSEFSCPRCEEDEIFRKSVEKDFSFAGNEIETNKRIGESETFEVDKGPFFSMNYLREHNPAEEYSAEVMDPNEIYLRMNMGSNLFGSTRNILIIFSSGIIVVATFFFIVHLANI